MLKFVKKDEPTKIVMTESDSGEIKIINEEFRREDKDEEKCQTESKSTE